MSVESFSNFFMSPTGNITVVVIAVILVGAFVLNMHKTHSLSVQTLTYSAICIALATVLSNVKLFDMPFGGTVTTCSMLFISLIGYWFGVGPGILAAATYGIMQLIFDPYVIHPVQLLLDYPLAFGALGISGFFSASKHGLYKGYILGALGRCLCSILSGVIFFYEYAGDTNVWIYSIGYNLSYIGPEMLITLAVISIPAFKSAIDQVRQMAGSQFTKLV